LTFDPASLDSFLVNPISVVAIPPTLLPAYYVLFLNGHRDTTPLSLSVLKRAYRQRALETHPDRVHVTGADPSATTARFLEVTSAYEALGDFLGQAGKVGKAVVVTTRPATTPAARQATRQATRQAARPAARAAGRPTTRPAPKPATKPAAQPTPPEASRASDTKEQQRDNYANAPQDHYWSGPLPQHELLLGQFLYYSGAISWRTLIGAIHWQYGQRQRFGEIAVAQGHLTATAWQRVLRLAKPLEPCGDAAVRLGYLSTQTRDAIVATQRWRQPRFGRYFIERGTLRTDELLEATLRQWQHNRACTR
jgi:hypothetical protein